MNNLGRGGGKVTARLYLKMVREINSRVAPQT